MLGGSPAARAMPAVVTMANSAELAVAARISTACRRITGHCS